MWAATSRGDSARIARMSSGASPRAAPADQVDQRGGVLVLDVAPSRGRRRSSYGAMVRILKVPPPSGARGRVDDGLVDHQQPRVLGLELARGACRSRWRTHALGGAEPGGRAADGRSSGRSARSPRSAACTAKTLSPGRQVSCACTRSAVGSTPSTIPGSRARWPPATTARPAPHRPPVDRPHPAYAVGAGLDRRDRCAADHPPAVLLDERDQRVGQRLAAADRRGPAEVDATGGQRRRQEAGARTARVLDRGHRQPEHERADHRMREALVDDVPGRLRAAARGSAGSVRRRAAGGGSSTGRGPRETAPPLLDHGRGTPSRRARTSGRSPRTWRRGRGA